MYRTRLSYTAAAFFVMALILTTAPAFADTPTVTLQPFSGQSASVGVAVTFTAVPANFTSTSYTYTVSDTDTESKVTSSNIDSTGHFSWTPTSDDLGLHTLIVSVSAGGQTATVNQRVDVGGTSVGSSSGSRTLTLGAPTPGSSIAPGTAVTFSATAAGFTATSFYTSDSFSPTSVRFDSTNTSGVFSWTPSATDVGTHSIKVVGYDGASNNASASTTIVVSGTASAPAAVVVPAATTVTTAPAYIFTLALQSGSTGAEVIALQQLLYNKGYLITAPNGNYGSATVAAVKAYQTAHGISPIGTVGPATRAALNAESGGGVSTSVAASVSTSSGGMLLSAKQVLLQIAQQLQLLATQLTSLASQ